MVQIDYKFRMLTDYHFVKKLKQQSERDQRNILLRLTHIKGSSRYFKKKHNIILPEVSERCVNEKIYKDETIGQAFHRTRDYENKIPSDLNDEEKNILTAILLTQTMINGATNQNCYILTSDSNMVKKYETNPHMDGIKRVQIIDFNKAIERVNDYFQRFISQRQDERL